MDESLGPIDTRRWRVGTHYGVHIYADNGDGTSTPIATAFTAADAKQIVREHNDWTADDAAAEIG